MGCWNKTCGLSNLYITAGTEVYVFVLEDKHRDNERCYSTALWSPLLLPFTAVYDDYGGGEQSSSMLQHILDGLKEKLIEKELGKNQYHDIEVKADKLDEKLFFEAVHEGRLSVRGYNSENTVDFVMFRKDVVDRILNTYVIEHYVGNKSGTTGYELNYIKYGFKDVLADIPAFMDKLETMVTDPNKFMSLHGCDLDRVFEWNGPNKAAWYTRRDSYRYSQIVRIDFLISELLKDGKRAEAEAVFTEHIRASFLDSYMDSIRKIWAPGCFEGSQSQEIQAYRTHIAAITAVLDEEQREYDEANDD